MNLPQPSSTCRTQDSHRPRFTAFRRFALALLLELTPFPVRSQGSNIWTSLYSTDTGTFAANLRKAGVPEATVGLLVSQEINARFKAQEAKLRPSLETLDQLREGWSAERREALLKLKHERNAMLREILGAVPEETAKIEQLPETLDHLSAATRENVRMITEDYDAMRTRIYTESRGALLEEDRAKLRYLEGERSADLVKAVGEADALDLQIYYSGYLRRTQARLEIAKPTAREIREMFLIHRRLNLDIASSGLTPPAGVEELGKQAMAELAKVLSPERFAEIRLAGSRRYQQVYHLVRRLGLDAKLASEIYAAQQRMCAQAFGFATAPQNRGPDGWSRSAENSKRLLGEHCNQVRVMLGDNGFLEYYKLNERMLAGMAKGNCTAPDTNNFIF